MTDSPSDRLVGWLAAFTPRELAALGVVAAMLVASHVLAPAVVPDVAVYVQYATYLVVFSVWMAWFVDWLAVRLGNEPHPSERDG